MAAFPILLSEKVVQVGDKTRLDCSRSFDPEGDSNITSVSCRPAAGETFKVITADRFLDWVYATAGEKTVTVRIVCGHGNQAVTVDKDFTVSVLSVSDDKLFSNDSDIAAWEPGIFEFIRPGRASYLDVHREAQTQILDWFDSKGIRDVNNQRLTKVDVVDVQEVREWSKFLTLQIIFEGLSNAIDDVFDRKARKYKSMADTARNRASIKLDLNGDGNLDESERVFMTAVKLKRV